MKEKLINLSAKLKEIVKPNLLKIDEKVNTLIPNPKTKRILYIALGSLFTIMSLIIILGIIISPLKNDVNQEDATFFKRPKKSLSNQTSEPVKEISKTKRDLLELQNKIINLTFPESSLNIPIIEKDISI